MIVKELIEPKSIVVIGASNDFSKPGGRLLKNLIESKGTGKPFAGSIYVVNPKEDVIQGIKCVKSVEDLPETDLAIIAIASKYAVETVEVLAKQKNTKAFIILSAGFSEIGAEGKVLEDKIVSIINSIGGTLIGPNCVGVLTTNYTGIFTGPFPRLDPKGCDFVTGSGATAVFILETAIPMGIRFSSLFSVGNSAQTGVEDILEYWDNTFDSERSSKVKIVYIEQISNPKKFLKHCQSLINKGCRIAAIKSGTTDAGSRAVSSHTGALAGSDSAVDALFRKAGVIRCYGRSELAYVLGILMQPELRGDRIAVITHAGGPGVMLTDTLDKNGMQVPHIEGEAAEELLSKLFHGSSVANPIDFLATGTAEQLEMIMDYVDNKFDNIDGMAIIFGTPGLFDIKDVYKAMHVKMLTINKPVYPILPSVVQAQEAINYFLSFGRIGFADETLFGQALAKVYHTPKPFIANDIPVIDTSKIRKIIDSSTNGYLEPGSVSALLDAAGIPRVPERTVKSAEEASTYCNETGFPVVMKVVGPVHKSDVGGVRLNIQSDNEVRDVFTQMMNIEGAVGVLIQKMIPAGTELFIGAKYEDNFGHIILCGLGGIFVEVLKDVSAGLAPIGKEESLNMIRSLKAYKIIQGVRGRQGIDEDLFAEIISRLSALVDCAPEIKELDINPLLGYGNSIVAVDARILIGR